MKKFLAATLAIVICLSIALTAFADVDLSSMSIEDLNALIDSAKNEILKKGGDMEIPGGIYRAGVDIAPGSYEIMGLPEQTTTFVITDSEGHEVQSDFIPNKTYLRINIDEGCTLDLRKTCYIKQAAKIGFFGSLFG